jgi:hypothetical protein
MISKLSRQKRIQLLISVAVLALLAGTTASRLSGQEKSPTQALLEQTGIPGNPSEPPTNRVSLDDAKTYRSFPLYYAGFSTQGKELASVNRITVSAVNSNDYDTLDYRAPKYDVIEFNYGTTCEPTSCRIPLALQIWPACARSLSLYDDPLSPRKEEIIVRGVPAAFIGGQYESEGTQLEIMTADVDIVIFAASREEALAVAETLRPLDASLKVESPLPEPVEGAVAGRAPCPATSTS